MAETTGAAFQSKEHGRDVAVWSRLSWMVLGYALPIIVFLIVKMMRAADYVGRDNDDAMRLVQVRDLLAGQGWFDLTQTRLGLDGGTLMHWSRLVDLPIAALIALFRPVAGPEQAEVIALAVWPILLVVPLLAAMGLAGRRIGGPQCMHFCLGLTAISIVTGNRFQAGAIDHHNVQLVLVAAMAAMLVDRRYRATSFAIAGAAAALAIAIGVETTPFVASVCLVVALLWAFEGAAFAAPAAAFGVTLAATVSAAFFLTVPPHLYQVVTCDNLSIAFFSLSAAGGALLALSAAAASGLGRPGRLAVLGACGLVLAGILLSVAPQCLRNPLASLDPLLLELWLNNVTEAQSFSALARHDPGSLAAFYFAGLFAVLICLWRIFRGERVVPHLILLALVFVNWAIALFQVRGAVFSNLLAILPISLLLVSLRSRMMRERSNPRASLLYVATVLVSVPAVWALSGELAFNGVAALAGNADAQGGSGRCNSAEAMADLRTVAPTLVVDPSNMGASILRFTEHRALSAPYHRNPGGMLAELRIGLADPDAAAVMLKRLGDPVLAFCAKDPQTRMIIDRATGGLYGRLSAGDVPSFLTPLPVTGGSELRLFRLRSGRD
ncbi:hypothetical protein [Sinorhizobium saheli]|uniref:Polysaccharide biosynthesis protein GtrA n=1 Tax=Sinorhizobium saheli TaxID=36856 RepID=A0A178YHX9_SINSA|nr:hypothetical protein [Sinorhizobium saheli]MQW87365.1 hypothetical protein [Sinorhizobium saheli]OAP46375.1 hypothetical protein ATB98_10365 [Sinorhizobium saheli]